MSKRTQKTPWRDTPAGKAAYTIARAEAQRRANATGYDHRIEANDLFREWMIGMLPARQNRYGHELTCEVVMPERIEACKPGHGPAR